jgi:hypothetical protein
MTATTEKIPSEDREQMLLVQWFRRTYPGVRIFAIPKVAIVTLPWPPS